MFDKLEAVAARHAELTRLLADPEVINRRAEFQKLSKEHADISELVGTYQAYRKVAQELEDNRALLEEKDPDLKAMAREEQARLGVEKDRLAEQLKVLLLPKDPNDDKNILLEIRGGTGGEEAALFAADLFRMYCRYAERNRWRVEVLSASEASAGGYKEIIAAITGDKVYSALKYESGVHRVPRVPAPEAQGRIHTSTATVAVLAEAEEVDLKIDEKDLEIKVSRSGGPGGQSVNTTDSAVQILHLPSGIQVRCTTEKSQHKNRSQAMKILRAKLLEIEQAKRDAAERDTRRSMVGSGERSEKIRTYNFPQDRMTDHRIGLTAHNLPALLDGEIQPLIESLRTHFQAESLKGEAG